MGAPGGPPQGYGGPPPGPMGGAPMGGPQPYDPFAPPQRDLPGGMDDLARRLPQSKPGTLFGVPLSTLRDVGLQRKALFFLGIALIAAIFVPLSFDPFVFAFKGNTFRGLVWPLIAGGSYLLVAAAPPHIRSQVPPVVLQWLPFGVSYTGLFMIYDGMPMYALGMGTISFGLLARLQNPSDQIARIIIAIGAGCLLIPFIDLFDLIEIPGAVNKIHIILWLVVMVIGIACALYVVPPAKLPPALQAVDAFAPAVTAVLLLWLPLQVVLIGLGDIVHGNDFLRSILGMARGLLAVLAYFGVLMLTAPAAYDAIMGMVKGNRGPGGPPGGGYPPGPPGGGYPPGPPGGGYPPPGGGYPPQGGGFPPPQGGGYPPQGGGFPPPQGGGFPPPQGGGGGWPQQ